MREQERKERAARLLVRVLRSHLARQRLLQERATAAVTIQRAWRDFLQRCYLQLESDTEEVEGIEEVEIIEEIVNLEAVEILEEVQNFEDIKEIEDCDELDEVEDILDLEEVEQEENMKGLQEVDVVNYEDEELVDNFVKESEYIESYSSSESDDPSDRSFEFNVDKEAGDDATDAAGWRADPSLSPGWQLRPAGQAMHYRSPQLQVFTSRLSVLQHCIRVKTIKC